MVSKSRAAILDLADIKNENIFLSRDRSIFAAHISECELKSISRSLEVSMASMPITPHFETWFWVISNSQKVSVDSGYAMSADLLEKYLGLDKADYLSCWPVLDSKTTPDSLSRQVLREVES